MHLGLYLVFRPDPRYMEPRCIEALQTKKLSIETRPITSITFTNFKKNVWGFLNSVKLSDFQANPVYFMK